jgi:hypothetical protein
MWCLWQNRRLQQAISYLCFYISYLKGYSGKLVTKYENDLMYSYHAKMTFFKSPNMNVCINSIYLGFRALIYLNMLDEI